MALNSSRRMVRIKGARIVIRAVSFVVIGYGIDGMLQKSRYIRHLEKMIQLKGGKIRHLGIRGRTETGSGRPGAFQARFWNKSMVTLRGFAPNHFAAQKVGVLRRNGGRPRCR